MKKVITYGTYDLLHQGHINLLKRAKELGDYLIVGVTSRGYDIERGKLNVKQSLMERIKNVEETGLADEIIIEEYPGQKIDDIKKYGISVFAIGSDWEGTFDYLKEYCDVVYLTRTAGISSTELRTKQNHIKLGIYSNSINCLKFVKEIKYINGLTLCGIFTENQDVASLFDEPLICYDLNKLIENCDAIYVDISPHKKYKIIKKCLDSKIHVLSESPFSLSRNKTENLFKIANKNDVILFDTIKTGYNLAFNRMILLIKSGEIGIVKDISVSCTSLSPKSNWLLEENQGGSLLAWGAYALLPIFELYGKDYKKVKFDSLLNKKNIDEFSKINFIYENAFADAKVAIGVKSEGSLTISGTKGYIYVPSPWWKTEYFELRFENFNQNRRFFYKLDGEGIRNALASFMGLCQKDICVNQLPTDYSVFVSNIFEDFYDTKQ